ncbi:hypothetical protein SAMN05444673_2574 [Bacillus sp. OV166]|uniref:hypothetical protein n=1 Tax=Bacillus sp. OV166 TaxID=1882763 RepID=UPI000A2AC40E|nr:hypothetical protein [Bacillus sp. OV166]SMQ75935.1 hypothetical protein SAMN05444673_2574 [Bacillus sp. OV166]
MDKKRINKFLMSIGAIMILFPILINILMFINIFPVSGDQNSWISTLGTFWGAILGGVISGALTLIGVNITVKSSTEGINKTLAEQNLIREQEVFLQTSKERLFNFYHPVDALNAEFIHQYGAHSFSDLNNDQQKHFLSLMNQNVIYGDSVMYSKFIELKWASKEKKDKKVNRLYNEIIDLITDEIIILRERLKLPVLFNHNEEDE